MKLVDANVLLYAVNLDAPHHSKARAWWENAVGGDEPIGLAWTVVLTFLRVATHPSIFLNPLSVLDAIGRLNAWLNEPTVRLLPEGEEHWRILQSLLNETGTAGNLTNDAHLAALAIGQGATLVSCDTDFARFRQLRWENPLDTE